MAPQGEALITTSLPETPWLLLFLGHHAPKGVGPAEPDVDEIKVR